MREKLTSLFLACFRKLAGVGRRVIVNCAVILFCCISLIFVSELFRSRYIANNQTISLYFNSYGDHARPSFLPADYHLTYNPAGDDSLAIIFAPTSFCGETGVSNEIGLLLTGKFRAELRGFNGEMGEHPRVEGARTIKINECGGGRFRVTFTGQFFDAALGHVSLDMYLDSYFLGENYSPKFTISGIQSLTSIEMQGYEDTGVSVRDSGFGAVVFELDHKNRSQKIFWFRGFDRWAGSNSSYELFLLGVIVGLLCSFAASAVFDLSHRNKG